MSEVSEQKVANLIAELGSGYLVAQLGELKDGNAWLVHSSTRRALRNRGLIDQGQGLTELGEAMLSAAKYEVGET